MKASELKGKTVVALESAAKLGKVDDVLVDTEGQRIGALQLKRDNTSAVESVPTERVHSIGKDAITLEGGTPPRERGTTRRGREAGNGGMVPLGELVGISVLSYDGSHLGTLFEVVFDPETFQITRYLVGTGILSGIAGGRGLGGSHKELQASPDVHFGKGIMTVPEDAYGAPDVARESEEPEESGHSGAQRKRH